jgi:Catalytic LigB subunit of aromatic ring-opening dioxygenase
MSVILSGLASSHAYAFTDPAQWDARRERTRNRYKAKFGSLPAEVPAIEKETVEGNVSRFKVIQDAFVRLKTDFEAFKPDVLIMVGDDQDELYRDQTPQFAIYTGEKFVSVNRDGNDGKRNVYRNDRPLANHLYQSCLEQAIDVVGIRSFADDQLISHAHAQIMSYLDPNVPVIPLFVNAIHVPAPSPNRCYAYGRAIRAALATWPAPLRVACYASGGLSHFSAGFPYEAYAGPYQVGSIAEDVDRRIVGWLEDGQNAKLGGLSSSDLLDNGLVELRQWVTLMGILGDRKPAWLVYDAFYRAIMGISVGSWAPFDLSAESRVAAGIA